MRFFVPTLFLIIVVLVTWWLFGVENVEGPASDSEQVGEGVETTEEVKEREQEPAEEQPANREEIIEETKRLLEQTSGQEDDYIIINPAIIQQIDDKAELITVAVPALGARVTSPLTITGQARGYWFFEASFPIVLVDWDGKIIAEHYATAEGEWMTEDLVPFTSVIEFESPYHTGDPEFMSNGALILRRDNPSGLPENDDALEIPIRFTTL